MSTRVLARFITTTHTLIFKEVLSMEQEEKELDFNQIVIDDDDEVYYNAE